MKHARADYDRFQDPANLIPEDEPVMLFRGQDRFAPAALYAYAKALEEHPSAMTARPMIEATIRQAQAMEAWQTKKYPDMPTPIRVGDRVEAADPPGAAAGWVIALFGDDAWVNFDRLGRGTVRLADLRRAEEAVPRAPTAKGDHTGHAG